MSASEIAKRTLHVGAESRVNITDLRLASKPLAVVRGRPASGCAIVNRKEPQIALTDYSRAEYTDLNAPVPRYRATDTWRVKRRGSETTVVH